MRVKTACVVVADLLGVVAAIQRESASAADRADAVEVRVVLRSGQIIKLAGNELQLSIYKPEVCLSDPVLNPVDELVVIRRHQASLRKP